MGDILYWNYIQAFLFTTRSHYTHTHTYLYIYIYIIQLILNKPAECINIREKIPINDYQLQPRTMHSRYVHRQAFRSSATDSRSVITYQREERNPQRNHCANLKTRTHAHTWAYSANLAHQRPQYSINLSLLKGRVVPVHTINVHREVNVQHYTELQFILIRLTL